MIEVCTDGEAVIVARTVTGLASVVAVCTEVNITGAIEEITISVAVEGDGGAEDDVVWEMEDV